MSYQPTLNLTRSILKNFHIDSYVMPQDQNDKYIDGGLRAYFNLQEDYNNLFVNPNFDIKHNTIYNVTDIFMCNYIFMRLPDEEQKMLIIGPYTNFEITKDLLLEAGDIYGLSPQLFAQIEKYYSNIPIAKDDWLAAIVNAFGEAVWGGIDNYNVKHFNHSATSDPLLISPQEKHVHQEDPLISIQVLEYRYEAENRLMRAVSQGAMQKAELMISNTSHTAIEKRNADPLRNMKNYTIILNTLLRKAAEQGLVHPLHIDHLSSNIARRIENIASLEEGQKLQKEMVVKYCRLVKNHSMKNYSLLVQKVITRIDMDITADLSLKSQAQLLNINASYLSTLFKKETGQTLTDYVNNRRVEFACVLLKNTNLQVQTVAQQCGILDVNYFTKTFKKYKGQTPKEYRESLTYKK